MCWNFEIEIQSGMTPQKYSRLAKQFREEIPPHKLEIFRNEARSREKRHLQG